MTQDDYAINPYQKLYLSDGGSVEIIEPLEPRVAALEKELKSLRGIVFMGMKKKK